MKKQSNLGNYTKLSPLLHEEIARQYKTAKYTTEQIAKNYSVTPRTIQRIAKKLGVIRTQSEANKIVVPLKAYHRMRIPEHLKAQRKQISNKLRYEMYASHPYCSSCGTTSKEGTRLEIDHIDNNATNNDPINLQVLCHLCNKGKSDLNRFGSSLNQ